MQFPDQATKSAEEGLPLPQPDPPGILPPSGGKSVVPHYASFASIVNSLSRTYRWTFDEALRDSWSNSLALRRDPVIMDALRARQLPTAQLAWHLEAQDDTDTKQTDAVKQLTHDLEQVPNWQRLKMHLLEAVFYGRYGVQLNYAWDFSTGRRRLVVRDFKPVNGDKLVFRFSGQVGILVHSLQEPYGLDTDITDRGRAHFLSADEREQLIIHHHEPEDADFYEGELAGAVFGVGIRSRLYWFWWMRAQVLGWLMDYLQRIGAGGLTIWFYEAGNPKSYEEVQTAAQAQATNNIILFPRYRDNATGGPGIQRVDPSPAGVQLVQELITGYFDAVIRQYILGQTLSSGTGGTGLGSGVAELHADTFARIVKYDAINLGETITRDLVAVLCRYNHPGVPCPRFVFDVDKPNAADVLEAATAFFQMGGEIDADELRGIIGLAKPTPGHAVLTKLPTTSPAGVGAVPQGVPMQGQPGPMPGAVGPPESPTLFSAADRESQLADLMTRTWEERRILSSLPYVTKMAANSTQTVRTTSGVKPIFCSHCGQEADLVNGACGWCGDTTKWEPNWRHPYFQKTGELPSDTPPAVKLSAFGDDNELEILPPTETVPISKLTLHRRSLRNTLRDIVNNRTSRTKGPIDLWEDEQGKLLVTDGHHRLVEAMSQGKSDIPARIRGRGYSDLWASPTPEQTFIHGQEDLNSLKLPPDVPPVVKNAAGWSAGKEIGDYLYHTTRPENLPSIAKSQSLLPANQTGKVNEGWAGNVRGTGVTNFYSPYYHPDKAYVTDDPTVLGHYWGDLQDPQPRGIADIPKNNPFIPRLRTLTTQEHRNNLSPHEEFPGEWVSSKPIRGPFEVHNGIDWEPLTTTNAAEIAAGKWNNRGERPMKMAAPEVVVKPARKGVDSTPMTRPVGEHPPVYLTPDPDVLNNAREYMRWKGREYPTEPVGLRRVPEDLGRSVADYYHRTSHQPNDKRVRDAYRAFRDESLAQFNFLRRMGVKLEPWTGGGPPYKSAQDMRQDVQQNSHLYFDTNDDLSGDNHLSQPTGISLQGRPVTYRQAFRAVHNYFGHALHGNEFGPNGEDMAYRLHRKMYSPDAQPAMAFETRGQNSWTHFGPHLRNSQGRVRQKSEPGFIPQSQRPSAPQKNNLLSPELVEA